MPKGYVYILTNFTQSTLYRKYKCKYLVYYEAFDKITDAIDREKQLKNWHRDWKINLIKSANPNMLDLSDEVF
ncbi:MAG: GIY-YIG nuclease family protein [Candidatus Latescibacter sp.]|nr:GIY-YIG nuclease family protein [Candidatus Latescibacter sp.]